MKNKIQIPSQTDGVTPVKNYIYVSTDEQKLYAQFVEIMNARDKLLWMQIGYYITEDEKDTLMSMLNSPDEENINLALTLIEIKTNGTNLST